MENCFWLIALPQVFCRSGVRIDAVVIEHNLGPVGAAAVAFFLPSQHTLSSLMQKQAGMFGQFKSKLLQANRRGSCVVLRFWKTQIEQRPRRFAFILALLYFGGVSTKWYITNDSAMYLLLAKSLAHGEGYALFGQPHGFVPPGFPFLLSLLMRMGLGSYFFLNLCMAVVGLAAIYFSNRYLKMLSSPRMALLATVLFGLSYQMHRDSLKLLSDVPFVFCVSIGLFSYARALKGRSAWIAVGVVAFVCSCWIRIVGVPITLAATVGLLLQVDRTKRIAVLRSSAVVFAGIFLTGLVFVLRWQHTQQGDVAPASYASAVAGLWNRSFLDWLRQPFYNAYRSFPELGHLFAGDMVPPSISLVFIVPILVGAMVHIRRGAYLGVVSAGGYVGALLMNSFLVSRYFLPVAPLLCLYFVEGIHQIFSWKPEWHRFALPRTLAVVMLLATIHLGKDIRFVNRIHQAGHLEFGDDWADLRDAAQVMNRLSDTNSKFMGTKRSAVIAYLSGVPYLDFISDTLYWNPPKEELARLLEQHNIDWLVVDTEEDYPLSQALVAYVGEERTFRPVHRNKHFSVYHRGIEARPALANRPETGPLQRQ